MNCFVSFLYFISMIVFIPDAINGATKITDYVSKYTQHISNQIGNEDQHKIRELLSEQEIQKDVHFRNGYTVTLCIYSYFIIFIII